MHLHFFGKNCDDLSLKPIVYNAWFPLGDKNITIATIAFNFFFAPFISIVAKNKLASH